MTTEAAVLDAIAPLVAAAIEDASPRSSDPDAELCLRSIEVITLVDLLEAQYDIVLTSDDVRPEHFTTRRSIARLLLSLGVAA